LELYELDGTTLPVWQWPDLPEGGMGLQFVDVDDPTAPHRIGRSVLRADALGMAAAHGHAYVAAGPCGLRTLDLADPIRPREVASEPGHAQDVAISGQYGYVLMAATSLIPGCTSGPDPSGRNAP
jgi:hypothetical protein